MSKPTVARDPRDVATIKDLRAFIEHLKAQHEDLKTIGQRVVKASAHQWPVDGMAELARAVKGVANG